jgi:pimeloyl-ACP methyl ester carboxylesterase
MQTRNVLLSGIANGAVGIAAGGASLPSAAAVRPGGPRIRTRDGIGLFHREWGSGQPLLFVHSLSLSSTMWSYQEAFLGDHGIRCVSYDRRGHGRSDAPAHGYDLNTLADDLSAVVDSLDLQDLVLVGHSMGCGEIIRYIGRHGTSRVAKVVLLAPQTPYVLQTADNPYGAPPAYFDQVRAAWAADFPKWVQDNKLPFFTAETSAQMMEWIQTELLRAHVPTAITCNRSYVETDLRPDLIKVDKPVLILQGDKDVSAPLEITGRRTAMGIPGAVLKVYPGAPHGLFLTHMDQVNRDILEFVRT